MKRTHLKATTCPFCGSSNWRYDGEVLLSIHEDDKGDVSFFKMWCDRCDRFTFIEMFGSVVPEEDSLVEDTFDPLRATGEYPGRG